MTNKKNLKPVRTKDEARERGRNGGIASGITRRRKIVFCKLLQMVGNLPASNAVELSKEFPGLSPYDITNQVALALAIYRKALDDADPKAIETILHLTSQDKTFNEESLSPTIEMPFDGPDTICAIHWKDWLAGTPHSGVYDYKPLKQ